jgi:hypothetical protein
VTAYILSIAVSLAGVFIFLVSCYYALTNADMTVREVLPGAIFASILLEATFQVLPFYQRYADLNPGLRAFGAPAILLVWLYVMANVIVFGSELNWWRSRRREQQLVEELTRSGVGGRARRSRGASAAPSTRHPARRPCGPRHPGRTPGRSRTGIAVRLCCNPPAQPSPATQLLAGRRQRDELADVARTAALAVDALRAQSASTRPRRRPALRDE